MSTLEVLASTYGATDAFADGSMDLPTLTTAATSGSTGWPPATSREATHNGDDDLIPTQTGEKRAARAGCAPDGGELLRVSVGGGVEEGDGAEGELGRRRHELERVQVSADWQVGRSGCDETRAGSTCLCKQMWD
jgi:hypothetical protein